MLLTYAGSNVFQLYTAIHLSGKWSDGVVVVGGGGGHGVQAWVRVILHHLWCVFGKLFNWITQFILQATMPWPRPMTWDNYTSLKSGSLYTSSFHGVHRGGDAWPAAASLSTSSLTLGAIHVTIPWQSPHLNIFIKPVFEVVLPACCHHLCAPTVLCRHGKCICQSLKLSRAVSNGHNSRRCENQFTPDERPTQPSTSVFSVGKCCRCRSFRFVLCLPDQSSWTSSPIFTICTWLGVINSNQVQFILV